LKDIILGVDPGLSGAICFFNPQENKIEHVDNFPLRPVKSSKTNKKEIDLYNLQILVARFAARTMFAVIEKVNAMPGQGVTSMFRFGESYGQIQGLVSAFEIPITFITPAVWKPMLGLSRDKNESRALACKLFPASQSEFKRKKDDGKAEAALLARYGVNTLGRAF